MKTLQFNTQLYDNIWGFHFTHRCVTSKTQWTCSRHEIWHAYTGRGHLKCDGTRAWASIRLSAKRTSPFKSAGGRQFSRLLAGEVCASAVVMLDTLCSELVWRVLAAHCIRQFPLHFPSRVSPCAIKFQLLSTVSWPLFLRNSHHRLHTHRKLSCNKFHFHSFSIYHCLLSILQSMWIFWPSLILAIFIWLQITGLFVGPVTS